MMPIISVEIMKTIDEREKQRTTTTTTTTKPRQKEARGIEVIVKG